MVIGSIHPWTLGFNLHGKNAHAFFISWGNFGIYRKKPALSLTFLTKAFYIPLSKAYDA
jgi:hypothetical protein